MTDNKKVVIIECPKNSTLLLLPENRDIFHSEFEKWKKTVESLVRATVDAQHITEKDLSVTMTI